MAGKPAVAEKSADNPGGIGLFHLIMSVVTLVVGSGIFSLCSDMAASGSNGQGILLAWAVTAFGVTCLVVCFFVLSRVKPKMKGGIYMYAKEGFGPFVGFCSAYGYWISAILCIVAFSSLLFGAFSTFFPDVFNPGGNNLASIIGESIVVWFYVWLVSRGVKEAAAINAIVTIAKLVPIFTVLVIIVFAGHFHPDIFAANFSMVTGVGDDGSILFGADAAGYELDLFGQMTAAITTTMWVFVGIEAAVAISGRAKRESDVGKATIISFACIIVLYLAMSMLSLGVMPLDQLAGLDNPPLSNLMRYAVGDWGAMFVSVGVALSLLGGLLGYTVLTAESPYEAAVEGAGFPKFFAKSNEKDAPVGLLVVNGIIVEIFFVMMMLSESAYQFFYTISLGMILLPYLFSAAYMVKIAVKEPQEFAGKVKTPATVCAVVGVFGVLYSLLLTYSTGVVGLCIMSFLFVPGILIYIWGRKQAGLPYLNQISDKVALVVIAVAFVAAVYFLLSGQVVEGFAVMEPLF